MPIKSTVTKATTPTMRNGDLYIGSETGVVVLVTAAQMNPLAAETFVGVVVHSGAEWHNHPIGLHDGEWKKSSFKPFNGTITLESTP